VTQPFGCTDLELEPFDPFCPHHHIHTGIDLAAPADTPVHAAEGGLVRIRFDPAGAGLYVETTDGAGTSILYCHLSAAHVGEGDVVTAGEVIGEVGSTGLATGAHLHLQVEAGGRLIDPAVWLASTS
jgi:murein DD-endopeptidase MepM/ murein hydrolase activator NlpD